AYRTALELDPGFVPARVNLAILFNDLERKDEAEAEYRKVIDLEPETFVLAEANYSLGLLAAENEQRLEEAAKYLGAARRLAPERARFHYNYGLAMQHLGQIAEAEEALKTACRLSPRTVAFLHALAIFYAQQESWNNAKACVEGLMRLDPANPQWASTLEYYEQESQGTGKTKAD
ncbi:unnamed protein product, partial [marine sediment metagenome]